MAGDVYPHFRAAAVQAAPVFLDREATISRLADWVAKARDVGDIFLKPEHFLVLEGYDPRIHALYYCPQLYKYGGDKTLVPLEGEEIGKLVVQAVQNGVVEKQPWYPPSEMLPRAPIVTGNLDIDFDRMVVDAPAGSSGQTTP